MSKKKKTPYVKEAASEAPVTRKVSFFAWFEKAKKDYKLRDYQSYAIQVFFEKHGLKDVDDPNKYDDMIQKF